MSQAESLRPRTVHRSSLQAKRWRVDEIQMVQRRKIWLAGDASRPPPPNRDPTALQLRILQPPIMTAVQIGANGVCSRSRAIIFPALAPLDLVDAASASAWNAIDAAGRACDDVSLRRHPRSSLLLLLQDFDCLPLGALIANTRR